MSQIPISCVKHIVGFLNKCTFCTKYGDSLEVKSYEFEVYKGFICKECATPPSLQLRKDLDDKEFFQYLKIDKSKYESDDEENLKKSMRLGTWRFTYSCLIEEYYKCFIKMNTVLKHPMFQPVFNLVITKMFDPPVIHVMFRGGLSRKEDDDDEELIEEILQNRNIYEEIGYNVDELIIFFRASTQS